MVASCKTIYPLLARARHGRHPFTAAIWIDGLRCENNMCTNQRPRLERWREKYNTQRMAKHEQIAALQHAFTDIESGTQVLPRHCSN